VLVRVSGIGYFRCHACQYRFKGFRGWGRIHTRLLVVLLAAAALALAAWGIAALVRYVG
jgi:hypothetical protein